MNIEAASVVAIGMIAVVAGVATVVVSVAVAAIVVIAEETAAVIEAEAGVAMKVAMANRPSVLITIKPRCLHRMYGGVQRINDCTFQAKCLSER